MISKKQVLEAQEKWGSGIVKIGSLKEQRQACEKAASDLLDELYAFDLGEVLFKPTKVEEVQFRPDKESALSYFIGGNKKYSEDKGFAITPFTNVKFENKHFVLEEDRAIAMGNYYFTTTDGSVVKVEYTFGYKLYNGALKIDLHHSSIPYSETYQNLCEAQKQLTLKLIKENS
ncbi:phosphoribosyl-AMP cyclohydrolase [Cytophagaceae bacterium ABcell3]|nr:phosphoribosyl-AMP cyclohydrolase [Cytophagaceae bacterium ABcell3]